MLLNATSQHHRRLPGGWQEPDALAVATWRNSGQLSHGDHDESEITPEDFLWETLPGRCCFSGRWDPTQRGPDGGPKWVSVTDCSQCQIWGQADASCHNGLEQCKVCGMDLYCPGTPPPLVGGAKVCTGSSRVGEGCNDMLKMGVCMTKDLSDCMQACQKNAKCEAVVYYEAELKGSCVLCGDLNNMIPTPHETTRIYSRVNAPAPPTPRDQIVRHYVTDSYPRPPPPAPLLPRATPPPPRPLVHLGWSSSQHFECTFAPRVEFSIDSDEPLTNTQASTRFECCNQCGLSTGCQDFVYEHASGLCVLLPHASSQKEIRRLPNPNVVSGSLQITTVHTETMRHGTCTFKPASGYTRGLIRVAASIAPGEANKPILTRQDCCDACLSEPACAKLSFQPESKQCTLFQPLAEEFGSDGLISAVLVGRFASATHHSGDGGDGTGGDDGEGILAQAMLHGGGAGGGEWGDQPLPPSLLAMLAVPPPAPPPKASELTKDILSGLSFIIFGLMALGFTMCAYCFFAQDIKRLIGIRVPPPGAKLLNAGGGGGKGKGKGRGKGIEQVSVTVMSSALTQTKEIEAGDVQMCDDVVELLSMLVELFPAVLRDTPKEQMMIQCRTSLAPAKNGDGGGGKAAKKQARAAAAAGGASDGWMLVTDDSEWSQVVECPAFRLCEKPTPFEDGECDVAFPKAAPQRLGKRAAHARRMADGGDDDDDDDDDGGDDDEEAPPLRKAKDNGRRGRGEGGGGRRSKRGGEEERGSLLSRRSNGRRGGDDEDDDDDDDDDEYEARAAEAARAAKAAAEAAEAAEAEAAARRRMKPNVAGGAGGNNKKGGAKPQGKAGANNASQEDGHEMD